LELLFVVLLAAIPWTLLFGSYAFLFAGSLIVLALALLFGISVVLFFPERAIAEIVYNSIVNKRGPDSNRLRNIADGLAIAINVPADRVEVIASPVPNVLALPTKSHGLVVIATEGAIGLLSRPELEALVASQIVVAGNPWVRRATRAQLAQAPWAILLGFASFSIFLTSFYGIAAFVFVFVFVFSGVHRRADAVRDLLADGVAINTTKNPQALVGALRDLRPAALVAGSQKFGEVGMLIDPFAVLSVRMKVSNTMTVNGKSRSWSTADEIATEFGVRAERMESVARGDFSALDGLGKADNPHKLTEAERKISAATTR
jgi:Zn-dependent protease with chaperone function